MLKIGLSLGSVPLVVSNFISVLLQMLVQLFEYIQTENNETIVTENDEELII